MKTSSYIRSLVTFAFIATATSAVSAEGAFGKWTLKIDIGAALTHDADIKRLGTINWPFAFTVEQVGGTKQINFPNGDIIGVDELQSQIEEELGIVLPVQLLDQELPVGGYSVVPKLILDPGVRFDLGLGYNISRSLTFEIESGLIFNSAEKIELTVKTPVGSLGISKKFEDFSAYQVPILANLIYVFQTKTYLKPYIGAGAGGLFAIVDAPEINFEEDDFVFAYQAMAGVAYQITDSLDLGIGYKFLGTSAPQFDGVKAGELFTHTVALLLRYNF